MLADLVFFHLPSSIFPLSPLCAVPRPCAGPHRLGSGSKKKLRSSTLRQIKQAAAAGLKVELDVSPAGLEAFRRLNCLTRRDHGLPPQPKRFFENLQKRFLSPGRGFIALARKDGRAVAGVLFLHFGRAAVFKYGASDRTFWPLRPNNLVMWEALRRCRDLGLESLCLGRTDLDHQGLKQFKDGWGAAATRIVYQRYDFRSERFLGPSVGPAGWREKVLRKMPLPLLDALGTVLYRHMG